MSKSILQKERECFFCGQKADLHQHHCMHGVANRKKADRLGLTVYLCEYHHTGSDYGVHFNKKLDLELKKYAQKTFEEKHGHDEWMREFGKNYL